MKKLAKIFLTMLILALAALVIVACDSKPSEFTVTFVYPDGEVVSTQTVEKGYAATEPEVKNTIDGVPFLAWDKDFSKITADTTVTAIYEFPTYKVSFDTKGGTSVEDQKIRYGQLPTKPADPEKPGYTFSKWYEDPDFTIECKFDKAYDTNTTIYAHFINDYTWISSVADLDAIRVNPTAKYILANDIDLGGAAWTPIETFSGILDGNGHKICNVFFSFTNDYLGFIANNDGILYDITFDRIEIQVDSISNINIYAGIFAAKNNGKIKNCTIKNEELKYPLSLISTSKNTVAFIGGIVGYNSSTGIVAECKNEFDIQFITSSNNSSTLGFNIGSMIGINYGVLEKTNFSGDINIKSSNGTASNSSTYTHLGGLVGINVGSGVVSECQIKSEINAEYSGTGTMKNIDIGLIIGRNENQVINCIANGILNISNTELKLTGCIGGAIGINWSGTNSNVLSNVDITTSNNITSNIGGVAGRNTENSICEKSIYSGNIIINNTPNSFAIIVGKQQSTIQYCYYSDTSNINIDESLTPSNNGGTMINFIEFQSAEFIYETLGWDSEIWQVNEGSTPTLKCFSK